MCSDVCRLKLQGIIVVSHGAKVVLELIFHEATVDEITGIVRLKLDGFVHVVERSLIVAIVTHGNFRAYDVACRNVFVERDALVHVAACAQGVALGKHQLCACQVGAVVVGIKLQQAFVGGCRGIVFLQVLLADGFVDEKHFFLRQIFQAHIVVAHRLAIFIQRLSGNAAHLIGIHNERIDFERLVAILLGTLIVVEVDFCHSTIEIRLGKIRLCLDYLIEILNRQHIILKIQGVATNVQHLLGVDLRTGFGGHEHQQQYI